jgi:hypothetical protein
MSSKSSKISKSSISIFRRLRELSSGIRKGVDAKLVA